MQTETILGKELNEDQWHVEMIRTTLTQNLPSVFPQLMDELPLAVQDYLPNESGNDVFPTFLTVILILRTLVGWTAVNVLPALTSIIARVSSRIFVGSPLCEYALEESLREAHVMVERSLSAISATCRGFL